MTSVETDPYQSSPTDTYIVLVNDEEQYSLWPDHKAIPAGWRSVEKRGTKVECLAFIEEVWHDITPLSVRRRLATTKSPTG